MQYYSQSSLWIYIVTGVCSGPSEGSSIGLTIFLCALIAIGLLLLYYVMLRSDSGSDNLVRTGSFSHGQGNGITNTVDSVKLLRQGSLRATFHSGNIESPESAEMLRKSSTLGGLTTEARVRPTMMYNTKILISFVQVWETLPLTSSSHFCLMVRLLRMRHMQHRLHSLSCFLKCCHMPTL